MFEQILAPCGLRREMVAADLEGEDAGAGAGIIGCAPGLVAETSFLFDGAPLHVIDRIGRCSKRGPRSRRPWRRGGP